MSWNNVLPWWIYELEYEHRLASMSCAFEEEWFSGTSRVMPEYNIKMSKATFSSWVGKGWNNMLAAEKVHDDDKGYSIGTKEKYDEFVAIRNGVKNA